MFPPKLAEAEKPVDKTKTVSEHTLDAKNAAYEAFNTAGNAEKIVPIPLDAMGSQYESGSLNQVVN